MKKYLLMLFLVMASIAKQYQAQNQQYLIDSLNYPALSKGDKKLIDSIIPIYYKESNEIKKLSLIQVLVDNLGDENAWHAYNDLILKQTENKPEAAYRKFYAAALNNCGVIAMYKGNLMVAVTYYTKSLDLRTQLKDTLGAGETLNNLGTLYNIMQDYKKSLDYFIKALAIYKKMNNIDVISAIVSNIGGIYFRDGNIDKALEYFNQALSFAQQAKNKNQMAGAYMWLGNIYNKAGNEEKAITYFNLAIANNLEAGDKFNLASGYGSLSTIYLKNNLIEAEKYALLSYEIGKELGSPQTIRDATGILYTLFKKTGKSAAALSMYEIYINMRDSINNKEQYKKVADIEFTAKEAATKAEQDKRNAIAAAETRKQKIVLLLVSCFLILVIVFAVFMVQRFRLTRRQKHIIEQQKKEVDEAYNELDEKNKEVMDSIRYAKRIQTALITNENYIDKSLKKLMKG